MLSATLQDGLSELRDRREDPRAAAEEEDGARRAGQAHRAVAGAAVEDRARPAVSDAADAAAHRAGLQRRPRVLLRRRARQAAGRGGAQEGARRGCPTGRARGRWPIGSSRSTTPPPSAASTPTTRSSFPWRRTDCGRTPIPASSSSTRCRARSASTSAPTSTRCGRRLDVFRFSVPHAYRRSGGRVQRRRGHRDVTMGNYQVAQSQRRL